MENISVQFRPKPRNIEPYALPLLIQGHAPISAAIGATAEQTVTTATGRGHVYAVDLISTRAKNLLTGNAGQVSLIIGGQDIYGTAGTDAFVNFAQPGNFVRSFTPVNVADAQTSRMIVNNNAAVGLIVMQQLMYYTNKDHTEFANKYQRLSGLGQKRFYNTLNLPAAAVGTIVQQGVLPKNLGNINAVSVQLGNVGMNNAQVNNSDVLITILINGVEIIQNVTAKYFSIPSFKRPQVFPAYIESGSTYEIRVTIAAALATTIDVNLITWYEN